MIVGGYSLHLYCDSEHCKARTAEWIPPTFNEFAGHNEADCMKQARQRGWKFRKGECFCPICNK